MAATDIALLVPWAEYHLSQSPWPGTWGFNPTIVRIPDDSGDAHAGKWLCNLRCANYHLPGSGAQENSTESKSGVAKRIRNRNWLLELDPKNGWNPKHAVEVLDRSGYANAAPSTYVLGYEDLRLAGSPSDGLIASATAMATNEHGVLEIVVLDLDDDYQIEGVQPLRGAWSERHQKNWMPFLGGTCGRWLYSPQDGIVHDRSGRLARVHRRGPKHRVPLVAEPWGQSVGRAQPTSFRHGALDVQMLPSRHRVTPPRQTPLDLRGGTQLVPVPEIGPDRFLGLVHACQIG